MRIGKDMIKQAEAQFLMDCALPPESAGTRQGYLIGKKPGMPEQDFMTDVSYGYLVRECMDKARKKKALQRNFETEITQEEINDIFQELSNYEEQGQ